MRKCVNGSNRQPLSWQRPRCLLIGREKGAILAETDILVAKTDVASLGRETDLTTRQYKALAGEEPTEFRLESGMVLSWHGTKHVNC